MTGTDLAAMISQYLAAIWDSEHGLVNEIAAIPAQAGILGKIAQVRLTDLFVWLSVPFIASICLYLSSLAPVSTFHR